MTPSTDASKTAGTAAGLDNASSSSSALPPASITSDPAPGATITTSRDLTPSEPVSSSAQTAPSTPPPRIHSQSPAGAESVPQAEIQRPEPAQQSPSLKRRGSSFNNPLSTAHRQNRIDEILTTARKRSVAFGDTTSPGMSVSPRASSRHIRLQAEEQEQDHHDSSSADEATGILRRARGGANIGYQSVRARASNTERSNNGQGGGSRNNNTQGAEPEQEQPEEREKRGLWQKYLDKFGAIELDNKGSVARDHLALERTFLAWLRTSLAFASIGVAVTQLFRLNTTINQPDQHSSSSSLSPQKDPIQNQNIFTASLLSLLQSSDSSTTHLRQLGKPLGATFLGISILTLFIGFHRYFESQHWIMKGKFPASRGSIALVSFLALALMVTSLIVVVVVEPRSFEKR